MKTYIVKARSNNLFQVEAESHKAACDLVQAARPQEDVTSSWEKAHTAYAAVRSLKKVEAGQYEVI